MYRLGRGGVNAMSTGDSGILGVMLDRQRDTWSDFMRRVAAGKYSEDQIRNYSRGFVNAQTTFYERANAESYGLPVLPQYPGDGQTRCNVGCKCHLRIVPLPGNGDFNVHWMLGQAEHCPDCVVLSFEWSPLRIRGGNIL